MFTFETSVHLLFKEMCIISKGMDIHKHFYKLYYWGQKKQTKSNDRVQAFDITCHKHTDIWTRHLSIIHKPGVEIC